MTSVTEAIPAVVVLCSSGGGRPQHLEPLAGRIDLRFVDADGLADAMPGARGLLLWDFFSSAVQDVWPHCDALEWIHVAAAGVDKLLFDGLRSSSVVVTNAHGTFSRPIAEFVLASIMAHAKLLHESHDLQAARTWQHRETHSVQGSSALIVGTGGIGRETAQLLSAVGMTVAGAGRSARHDDADFGEVHASADLASYIGEFDYVINAAPLTDATRGLFDGRVFAAMRPTAHFVNIGRGPSVVEADLVSALRDKQIDGASLDVFESEPLPDDSPLWSMPGVAVSAHMSGDVIGWQHALARQFVDIAERWLDGSEMPNVLDKQLGFVPGRQS